MTSPIFVPNCLFLLLIINFPIYIPQNYSCMIHFLLKNGGERIFFPHKAEAPNWKKHPWEHLTAAFPSLHVKSTQHTHGNKSFLFPSWRSPTIMLPQPRSVGLLDKWSLGQLYVFQSGWPNKSQHAKQPWYNGAEPLIRQSASRQPTLLALRGSLHKTTLPLSPLCSALTHFY